MDDGKDLLTGSLAGNLPPHIHVLPRSQLSFLELKVLPSSSRKHWLLQPSLHLVQATSVLWAVRLLSGPGNARNRGAEEQRSGRGQLLLTSKKITSPALRAEGWGRTQPVIPNELSSEVTSWLLCVSILTRESPNWGGSASGHSQDAHLEKRKGPMVPQALCRVLDIILIFLLIILIQK